MKNVKGPISIALSATIFGFYGVLSRLIASNFGAFSQNVFRNFFGLIFIPFLFLATKTKLKKIEREDVKWYLWWSMSGLLTMPLLFIAYTNLSIGTATFFLYSFLTISTFIFGKLVFKERLTLIKVLAIIFSLIGIALITTVSFDKLIYLLAAGLSGFFSAQWAILNKKISSRYPNLQLQLFDAIATFSLSLLVMIFINEKLPSFSFNIAWIWIIIFSMVQLLAQGFMIFGFKHTETQKGGLILLLELFIASILGVVFFDEVLSISILSGGLFIFLGASLPFIFKVDDNN